MMSEIQCFDEVALLAGELVEIDDTGHVVREGDDADTHCVRVNGQADRQSASKVHDQIVFRLDATRQVQQQYHVQYGRTFCTHIYTHRFNCRLFYSVKNGHQNAIFIGEESLNVKH